MHLKPYLVIKRDDDDDEDEDVEIHHHHHYHHGSHPDTMGVMHHDQYAGEYGSAMARVKERLHKHPSTWAAHGTSKSGLMAIVAMEYQELMEAKASGDEKHIEKELCDLAAACIRAYEHL